MNNNVSNFKKEFKLRIYKYSICLIKFLQKLPNNDNIKDIKRQVMRSGTSISANYFEAEAASSKKDFQNYFHISLKSGNETKFWLAIIRDAKICPVFLISENNHLLQETIELTKILASSLITMKKNQNN